LSDLDKIILIKSDNRGFARANNLAFNEIADEDGVVIFLNPDTFLPEDYISQAVGILSGNPEAGVVSGKLLGYDIKKVTATGRIDSTGIFRTSFGRWYDRGKGEEEL
jgi:GT2 family glycosyltransferase